MKLLEVSCPRCFSVQDEELFFSWLKRIPCVEAVVGEGSCLKVTVKEVIDETSLRELIALHARYRLPMSSLAHFRTSENDTWFYQPGTYWFDGVFGT